MTVYYYIKKSYNYYCITRNYSSQNNPIPIYYININYFIKYYYKILIIKLKELNNKYNKRSKRDVKIIILLYYLRFFLHYYTNVKIIIITIITAIIKLKINFFIDF